MKRSELLEENDRTEAAGKLQGTYENVLLVYQGNTVDRFAHLGRIIPGNHPRDDGSGQKEKEVWEAEERQALLQQEKANMAAELQAMEDQQNATAPAEQHHGDDE